MGSVVTQGLREVEVSYARLVLAGVVVAFAVAAASVFLVFLGSGLSGGIEVEAARGVVAAGVITFVALPFVACAVLVLGLPLALVAEKVCRLLEVGRWGALLAFGAFGFVAGLGVMALMNATSLIVLPAVAAAVVGRGAADWLAGRRLLLRGFALTCAAVLALSFLFWFVN
ncbi:hypothetical protein ABT324_29520 [Saccharopolyspora sp. NPDC000359]|uniref:hypothetical protein n=1 Tax=Saccharopolyspora sp. NPDC000359 TaxID=3154251 RepID=UPI003331C1CD